MAWKPIETAPLYQWILLFDDTWKTWGTGMKLDNGFLFIELLKDKIK